MIFNKRHLLTFLDIAKDFEETIYYINRPEITYIVFVKWTLITVYKMYG